MRELYGRYSWPLVSLGGLLAAACLASTLYINRVQSELARAVRHDATRMKAANELQTRLRALRYHSVLCAADPSEARRKVVNEDRRLVADAIADPRLDPQSPDDQQLLDTIARGYQEYDARLGLDLEPLPRTRSGDELARWAEAHPVRGLLAPCRQLEDREQDRMEAILERSEVQTSWAGRVLVGLGLAGALAGLLSGFATARGLHRRAAQLSVRVRAVQAQLDQEVGAMTVETLRPSDTLDTQLDHIVGRVREVCQRLQEQERDLLRAEQLAAVGQLAAGIAHEVRNPLTGIKFLVEGALRQPNPTPLTDEDLRLIRQEVVRIEHTVQGLLDFARTPAPCRCQHDLRALVAEAAGVARGRAEAKPVALRVAPAPDPVPASVDRDQLISLLSNLLLNAIDATPPGGTVEVRTAAGPGAATVEVADTGPGIDPAVAGRLFTPFVTTKSTGTGLGLTIAQRVARDHGGTLTAANRAAGGACFTLTLPAAENDNGEAAGC
jgi:signal transduction histidine kinase